MRQSALVGLPSSLHNLAGGTRGRGACRPPNFCQFRRQNKSRIKQHITIVTQTPKEKKIGPSVGTALFFIEHDDDDVGGDDLYLGSPAVLQIGGELAAWSPEGKYQFLRLV